jgi:hypothetical protein
MKTTITKIFAPYICEVASAVRCRQSQPKIVHREVAGVDSHRFTSMPTALWNETISQFGCVLSGLCEKFDEAFRSGADRVLLELLQDSIPSAAYELARRLMEALLRQQTGNYQRNMKCHDCNGTLQFHGYVARKAKTKMGPIKFSRAHYKGSCGHSAYPLDVCLGLDGEHGVLPDLQLCATRLAAYSSYEQALTTLQELLPVGTFSLHLQENITKTVAEQFDRLWVEETQNVQEGWLRADTDLVEKTVVVSLDGGMCRVRKDSEKYREFKLGVLGELGSNGKIENKTFVGTFDGADKVGERLLAEYLRRELDLVTNIHAVTDGADWIPPRIEALVHPGQKLTTVLDWFHATERLKDCANEMYPAKDETNKSWYEMMKKSLMRGHLNKFLAQLKVAAQSVSVENSKCETALKYFSKRRHMLKYQACRKAGLPIGSGIIEGGIRHVAKDRLDCAGMHWIKSGAGRILELRCLSISGRWDDYSQKLSKQRLERFLERKSQWLQAA